MHNEDIMDMIDESDKAGLDDMVHKEIWDKIMKDKELMQYYTVSLKLKDKIPDVDLWDRFQERLMTKKKSSSSWKKWTGAAVAAAVFVIAGLIFIPRTNPKEYSYAHLLESSREIRVLEQNEEILEEYKKSDGTALDYYYELANL